MIPTVASLYCIPTAKCKGSSFSTSSPTLVVFCFFLVVATLIGVRRLGGCFCFLTSFSHGCYVSFACSTKSIFIIEGPQIPRGCTRCTGDQRERQGTQRRKSRVASGLIAALMTEGAPHTCLRQFQDLTVATLIILSFQISAPNSQGSCPQISRLSQGYNAAV